MMWINIIAVIVAPIAAVVIGQKSARIKWQYSRL